MSDMARQSFASKVVWITGASSGIGKSLALAFHRAGAKLILSARRTNALDEVRRECGAGADVRVLPLDLSDLEELPGRVETALGYFGHVDCMVHNAGVALRDTAIHTDLDVDQRIMATNFFGPVTITKALLPPMLQRGGGQFVVVGSLSGKYGGPLLSSYAASKHALHGFFESLRAEVHSNNIRITFVIPGFIRTPIATQALTGDGSTFGRTLDVHERGMDPDECAERILRATERGKRETLVGGLEVYSVAMHRFFPGTFETLIRNHPVKRLNWLRRLFSFRTGGSG
jgi:short-subunit dehydrogenase